MKITLGPAGTGTSGEEGLKNIASLGLKAVEIEFVRGVYLTNQTAKKFGELAKKLKLSLSIHAPYYINLASKEKAKIAASKKRILQSCERGHHLGAKYIVFHAAFYQGRGEEEVYQIVKDAVLDMQKTINKNKWNVVLAPETTGKKSQFGDLDELLRLKKETKCELCVDFAHIYARNNGKINYDEIFKKLKPLKHIHSHFSGIVYTKKGERHHILTEASRLKDFLKYIKKYSADITIINESPDPVGDSVKAQKLLKNL